MRLNDNCVTTRCSETPAGNWLQALEGKHVGKTFDKPINFFPSYVIRCKADIHSWKQDDNRLVHTLDEKERMYDHNSHAKLCLLSISSVGVLLIGLLLLLGLGETFLQSKICTIIIIWLTSVYHSVSFLHDWWSKPLPQQATLIPFHAFLMSLKQLPRRSQVLTIVVCIVRLVWVLFLYLLILLLVAHRSYSPSIVDGISPGISFNA